MKSEPSLKHADFFFGVSIYESFIKMKECGGKIVKKNNTTYFFFYFNLNS